MRTLREERQTRPKRRDAAFRAAQDIQLVGPDEVREQNCTSVSRCDEHRGQLEKERRRKQAHETMERETKTSLPLRGKRGDVGKLAVSASGPTTHLVMI